MEVIDMNEVEKLRRLNDFGIPVHVLARECHCVPASIQNYIKERSIPSGSKQIAIKDGLNHLLNTITQIVEE
jgi:hypothetical protein